MKIAYNFSSYAIDINLLQKREDKTHSPLVPILLILLAMGGSLGIGWLWYDAHNKLALAQQQLNTVKTKMAALEAGLKQNNFNGQISDVLNQPMILKKMRPVTTQLLSQLNHLLPLYANVVQLDLNERGSLKLTLNFATSEDIISFSQTIQGSEHFKLVLMGAVTKVVQEDVPTGGNLQPLKAAVSAAVMPVYQTTFELMYASEGKGS